MAKQKTVNAAKQHGVKVETINAGSSLKKTCSTFAGTVNGRPYSVGALRWTDEQLRIAGKSAGLAIGGRVGVYETPTERGVVRVSERRRTYIGTTGQKVTCHNVTKLDRRGNWPRVHSDEGITLVNPENVLAIVIDGDRAV